LHAGNAEERYGIFLVIVNESASTHLRTSLVNTAPKKTENAVPNIQMQSIKPFKTRSRDTMGLKKRGRVLPVDRNRELTVQEREIKSMIRKD
jgi:hypothetical protein